MIERIYFIPGIDFETLAKNNAALASFQHLLVSIQQANWDVTKAEEVTNAGIKGLNLTMTRPDPVAPVQPAAVASTS